MEKTTTKRKALTSLTCGVFAAVMLSACGGGGPVGEMENYGGNYGGMSASSAAAGSALRGPLDTTPDDEFGNFNPKIWDENNWYECNCGADPEKLPVAAPWMAVTE